MVVAQLAAAAGKEIATTPKEMISAPIVHNLPLGVGATVKFVDEKPLRQARTWLFERNRKRMLLSGALRRVAARPAVRLGVVVCVVLNGWFRVVRR
jgi:hypothetical protein